MNNKHIIAIGGGGFGRNPRHNKIEKYILEQTGKETPNILFRRPPGGKRGGGPQEGGGTGRHRAVLGIYYHQTEVPDADDPETKGPGPEAPEES